MAEGSDAPTVSRRKPLVIATTAAVAILVVGGVLYFALRGGAASPTGSITPSTSNEVPTFAFRIGAIAPVPTVATQSPKGLTGRAREAGRQAAAVLASFYTEAFLDPANWTPGSYSSAWSVFDERAARQAQTHEAVLTAGTAAGSTYKDIQPGGGIVSAHVLMDSKGEPQMVAAKVTFTARGANDDGTTTVFVSTGQYFLRRLAGDWKVVAFDVHRGDRQQAVPTTSTSPSASPTEVRS